MIFCSLLNENSMGCYRNTYSNETIKIDEYYNLKREMNRHYPPSHPVEASHLFIFWWVSGIRLESDRGKSFSVRNMWESDRGVKDLFQLIDTNYRPMLSSLKSVGEPGDGMHDASNSTDESCSRSRYGLPLFPLLGLLRIAHEAVLLISRFKHAVFIYKREYHHSHPI